MKSSKVNESEATKEVAEEITPDGENHESVTILFFPEPSERSDDEHLFCSQPDYDGAKVKKDSEGDMSEPYGSGGEKIPDSLQTASASKDDEDATSANCDNEVASETYSIQWIFACLLGIYQKYAFVIQVIGAIFLAKAYPDLGAKYLLPEITGGWLAVFVIFVLAGFNMRTSEFVHALKQPRFNAFVQNYNFFFISAAVFGFSRFLELANILPIELADGMVVCACLPMTINMVLVLTREAGGHEASAIFNAAASNMLGVFLSPSMIFLYLGVQADAAVGTVFWKISARVVAPLTVGQVVQKTSPTAIEFAKKHKATLVSIQKMALVYIVYSVFCRTFEKESTAEVTDIMIMVFFQSSCLVALMAISWVLLGLIFPKEPRLRAMGFIGCTHKTVAMGIPLINTIYGDNPDIGLYTLPLLVWHPMQLILGSFFAPRLKSWVDKEIDRLGIESDDDDESVKSISQMEEGEMQINCSTDKVKNDEATMQNPPAANELEGVNSVRIPITDSTNQDGSQDPDAYECFISCQHELEGQDLDDSKPYQGIARAQSDPDGLRSIITSNRNLDKSYDLQKDPDAGLSESDISIAMSPPVSPNKSPTRVPVKIRKRNGSSRALRTQSQRTMRDSSDRSMRDTSNKSMQSLSGRIQMVSESLRSIILMDPGEDFSENCLEL